MPIGAMDYTAVCGCFLPTFISFMTKRATEKLKMRKRLVCLRSYVGGVLFGFVLCYLFWGGLLLRAGDIEVNPGPTPSDKQTTDKSSGGLRQTRLASARTTDTSGNYMQSGRSSSPAASSPPFSLNDVMAKLNAMDGKLDDVTGDVRDIKQKFSVMEEEVGVLKRDVQALNEENELLQNCNDELKNRTEKLEKKVDDLEGRSKRNNLLFFGLTKEENETNADCEVRLKEFLTDKLEMAQDVEFDRVHRVSPKPDSPLIARCVLYKDKLQILKCKNKLKGTSIFIGEDFSTGVRAVRRKLTVLMKEKRNAGARVSMIYDHLMVDGKKFFLSEDGTGLVPER